MPDPISSEAIVNLLNWFLWVAVALGVGLILISLAMMAAGRRNEKLLLSGLAAIALGVTVDQIFAAVMHGISLDEPYQFASTVIVAALLVISVLYFAIGNPERGGKTLFAAVLAAGFFAMIPALQALFGNAAPALVGSCTILIDGQNVNEYAASFRLYMPYGQGIYDLLVDFGDGSSYTGTIAYGQRISVDHTYQQSGNYVISAKASNSNHSCMVATPVIINPPSPWLAPFMNFGGMISGAISGIATIPLNWYYIVPEFDLNDGSDDWRYYGATTGVAVSALALVVSLRMISGFIGRDPEESVPETLRETSIVLSAILIAPYLYQVFASLCNRISEIPIRAIDFGGFFAGVLSAIAVGAVLGVFSSFFGFYAGALAVGLLLSNLTAAIRIFMIKGLVLAFPFIALLYLFPVTRGTAQTLISILAGLCIAGPVAAFVIAGLCTTAGPLATFLAPTFAYVLFPYLLSLAGGASPSAVAPGIARPGIAATSGAILKAAQSFRSKPETGSGGGGRNFGATYIRPAGFDSAAVSVGAIREAAGADEAEEGSRLAGFRAAIERASYYGLLARSHAKRAAERAWSLVRPAGREFFRSSREGFETGVKGFGLNTARSRVSKPGETIPDSEINAGLQGSEEGKRIFRP